MIDESQELNRKQSKDSTPDDENCGESSAKSNKEEAGTPTAVIGNSSSRDHPDTPYPYLIDNEKPNSEVERV